MTASGDPGRRAALITGAGRLNGIAAGIARRLADDGWDLALSFWRPHDAETVAGSRDDEPERREAITARQPSGRLGTPADIAGLMAFLLSDDGAWTTGQLIHTDGGFSA